MSIYRVYTSHLEGWMHMCGESWQSLSPACIEQDKSLAGDQGSSRTRNTFIQVSGSSFLTHQDSLQLSKSQLAQYLHLGILQYSESPRNSLPFLFIGIRHYTRL